jgi:hypothetical protein
VSRALERRSSAWPVGPTVLVGEMVVGDNQMGMVGGRGRLGLSVLNVTYVQAMRRRGRHTVRGRWRMVAVRHIAAWSLWQGSGGSHRRRCSWLAGRGRGVGEELAGTAAASGHVRRKKMNVRQC